MASVVVSGRVDAQVKESADRYLRAAGLSVADVIKTVWEKIARTGEVPQPEADEAEGDAAWESFMAFRASLPTQRSWLTDLTEQGMKDLVAARYE